MPRNGKNARQMEVGGTFAVEVPRASTAKSMCSPRPEAAASDITVTEVYEGSLVNPLSVWDSIDWSPTTVTRSRTAWTGPAEMRSRASTMTAQLSGATGLKAIRISR